LKAIGYKEFMFNLQKQTKLSKKTGSIITIVSAFLIILGFSLIFQGSSQNGSRIQNPVLPTNSLTPQSSGYLLSQSEPTRIIIPQIGVDTTFVDLGLASNNEIEIPKQYDEVGWYIHGPTPGELGPAVILGHVDSYLGPGVFFSLGQLNPGDIVNIERADGTLAKFRVDKLERYKQSSFPTSLVYGNINHAGLRLITCSGSYDRELKRYDSNLIVYASLIES